MTRTDTPSLTTAAVRLARGALFTALVCLLAAPAFAQTSIRVLVNEEPITSRDIQLRTKMLSLFTRGQQGEKQAIDQLIEERLMMQEAKRRNVDITDAEVDGELAKRARAANLNPEQFSQALRQAGIDPKTFKDFLRANAAWAEIVRARFRATVDITDQDVAAALVGREVSPEAQQTAVEYRLQQILFVVPQGAGEAPQRAEANAFRSAFQSCDQSLQQASGKPGIVVKPQIRREAGQLAGPLKEALAKLEIGDVSEPERVPGGIQIVAVCAKNAIAGQTEAAVEVREEISSKRGQLLARRYLRDLRSDAVIEYR